MGDQKQEEEMRKTMLAGAAMMLAGLMACGGGDAVDETGTADTEIFTDSPDTVGVPTVEEGGTPVDSVRPGTPGTVMEDSTTYGRQP
jgi:hypothetical protein